MQKGIVQFQNKVRYILASDRGDRLWWRISSSEKICFQLFSETRNALYDSDGLRKLVPLCGSPYYEAAQP